MNDRLDKIAMRHAGAFSPVRRNRPACPALRYLNASRHALEPTWAGPPRGPQTQTDPPRAARSHFDIDSSLWPFDAGIRPNSFLKRAANQSEWRQAA